MQPSRDAVDATFHGDVLAEEKRVGVAFENGCEPGVDRLCEREPLVSGEVDATRLLGDDTGRARRQRRDHLRRRRHLRQRCDLERDLSHLVTCREVVDGELFAGGAARRDEPARGAEDRVALVVGTNPLRRPVRDLRVRARVAQVAHRSQMEDGRSPPLAHPADELSHDAEHLGRVVAVCDLIADLVARGKRGLDPPWWRRNADPEPVVLAHEEERKREALKGDLRGRIERRLCCRVVERGIAERAEHDGVIPPGARHVEPRCAVDCERHPHRAR